MSAHLLEVTNLRTSFSTNGGVVQAVRGIDFHVDASEFLGIVGESGCGKSVTMLSITRLLAENAETQADRINFDDVDILSQTPAQMRKIEGSQIGMIFQDPMTCLNPLYTIGNQLTETLKIHQKLSGKAAKAQAIKLLEMVGISSAKSRLAQYPHEFSGGMRQRVMIAIAMSCNPKLLIADEPTTALDVTIQAQILELMRELKEKFSTATILITHDLGVIATVCTRVLVMYGGLIMEEGRVDDIFYHTAHPYTQGLLRSVPGAVGSHERLIPIKGSPPDLMSPPRGCPFAARCEYAMKICGSTQPALTAIGDGHKSACWLLHPSLEKQRKEAGINE